MITHGSAVTVYRTERDAFGDPLDRTGAVIEDCALLRHDTSEDREGGEQVTETATLAAPARAEIRATDDVVLADGTCWHVAGRPYTPHSPLSGWEPAQVVPLKRVTG